MSLLRTARLVLASAAWRGLGSERAGQTLIDGLGDPDESTQAAAGMLIERAGGRPLVRRAIERGEHLPTALVILGDLGEAEDAALIEAFVEDPEPEVARAAVSAMELLEARGVYGADVGP